MPRTFSIAILLITLALAPARPRLAAPQDSLRAPDEFTLVGDRHFVRDFAVHDERGRVHVVVEIPTGSVQKWEVDRDDGALKWEFRDGKPRLVEYLGYPGNYGMVPRTLLAKSEGGDGDPLDVLVLGAALPRGSVVGCRLIGALRLLDGGEQDDKLIAVPADGAFAGVESIEQLDEEFVGVSRIVELWFANYKGPGEMQTRGFVGPDAATGVLHAAAEAYRRHQD